jgi:hypothetical protein
MKRKTIDIESLREMEEKGYVEIYYPGSLEHYEDRLGDLLRWSKNYQDLLFKYRKVSIEKVLDFIDCEYICDVMISVDEETRAITWIYLYGKDKQALKDYELTQSKGKYVYVLTNEEYPELCKIGKAVNPLDRIHAINGAGTVSEWVLKFALPVLNDYKVENLVHRHFEDKRKGSIQGSSREFFEVSLDQAVDAVLYYGKDYFDGEPIYY